MTAKSSAIQLAKVLAYVLGRRPEEFGLVPDSEGFVRIKDLLKALGEEEGFRHVRRGFLDEIAVTLPDAPVELLEDRIRAKDRTNLPAYNLSEDLPKLLYTCVRRKSYPVVREKGISPGSLPFVVLSSDQAMARRIGRRSDASPVLLTVSVREVREAQVRVLSSGGTLYLAEKIPADCFTGPPMSKVQDEAIPRREDRTQPVALKQDGSFFTDPTENLSGGPKDKPDRRGTRPDWKQDRKRMIRTERKKGSRL